MDSASSTTTASDAVKRPRTRSTTGAMTTRQAVVNGKQVWEADKSVEVNGVRKRIQARGKTEEAALANWDRSHTKFLVSMGNAPVTALTPKATSSGQVITLSEWLQSWVAGLDHDKVQANSRERNRGLIKNHIEPHLGTKPLRLISEQDINTLLRVTLPAKKGKDGTRALGSSPIRGVFYILKNALTLAYRTGNITVNPIERVETIKKRRPKQENISEKMWIPKYLVAKTRNTPDEAYWVLAFFGVRQSERLGLEWTSFTNLDSKDGTLLVLDRQLYNNAEAHRLELKRELKTWASDRIIPLDETTASAFRAWRKWQNDWKQEKTWDPKPEFANLVFTDKFGNPIRQSQDNRKWTKLLEREGIPHIRQHAMRHMTATLLAEKNVPPEVAMAILGHASTAMTSYYTHIGLKAKKPAIDIIRQAFMPSVKEHISGQVDIPKEALAEIELRKAKFAARAVEPALAV